MIKKFASYLPAVAILGFLSLLFLFHALLAIGTVPAPNARNSTAVRGVLVSSSQPHPDFGDMSIVLADGRSFYVNRANEVDHFAWEAFLAEVQPGDEVIVTGVRTLADRWVGFRGKSLPTAGVATPDKVYMDVQIAADTWESQMWFSQMAFIFGAVLIGTAVLLFIFPFGRPPRLLKTVRSTPSR